MSSELSLQEIKKEWHGSYRMYIIGFIYCMVFTCCSFFFAATDWLPLRPLVYLLVSFAFVQAFAQLFCFLHVGQEAPPRWETLIFGFMVLILLIIAIGSLWIMHDLNDRVMSDMDQMNMKSMNMDTEALERHHTIYPVPAHD